MLIRVRPSDRGFQPLSPIALKSHRLIRQAPPWKTMECRLEYYCLFRIERGQRCDTMKEPPSRLSSADEMKGKRRFEKSVLWFILRTYMYMLFSLGADSILRSQYRWQFGEHHIIVFHTASFRTTNYSVDNPTFYTVQVQCYSSNIVVNLFPLNDLFILSNTVWLTAHLYKL